MAIQDKITRVIKCDAVDCINEVTFDPQNGDDVMKLPDWLKGVRQVTRGDKTQFTYCSDVCEVKGITAGGHNIPEPKKIAVATEGEVKQAAANVQAAEALKAKSPEAEAAAKVTLS